MQTLWKKIADLLLLTRLEKRWQKLARALAVVVVFCTTYMLILPAITMENEIVCGIDDPEHIHSESCYIYNSPELGPDGETAEIWEATLSEIEFTDSVENNICSVAFSQLGYEESKENVREDENGELKGYTRYGQWYGNPYGNWNVMFVSFCISYAGAVQADELVSSGITDMKLKWESIGLYREAENYIPVEGEIAFVDTNGDGEADLVGVVTDYDADSVEIIAGDYEDSVKQIEFGYEAYCGYAATENLDAVQDELIKIEVYEQEEPAVEQAVLMMSTKSSSVGKEYHSNLSGDVVDVVIKDQDDAELTDGSIVYIGQYYNVSLEFSETNDTDPWHQFEYNSEGYLTYQIPDNLKCKAFDNWHSLTTVTDNGTVENVGEYFVDADGLLRVKFYNDSDGVNFIDKYSNVDFWINFEAAIATSSSGKEDIIDFGEEVVIEVNVDGGAGFKTRKTHSGFNYETNTMDYTIVVEATHGLVKDLVIYDDIWSNHTVQRGTIVVTDLDGNLISPQPTVNDMPADITDMGKQGFMMNNFPEFVAGEGFIITYTSKLDDYCLGSSSVALWNGLYSTGKNSNDGFIESYTSDWDKIEFKNIKKKGNQSVLKDAQGNNVPVIEWEVNIQNSITDMNGTVVIDTLGEGLTYYTGKEIRIKRYDAYGNRLSPDAYVSWDDVRINGNQMEFNLPSGHSFDVIYYTQYEDLGKGEEKHYENAVITTVNNNEVGATGSADVIGFIPRVEKIAGDNNGQYIDFTVSVDVSSVLKDKGHFYLTDMAAFWGGGEAGQDLYVENIPQDLTIVVNIEGQEPIEFTPYVEGGPITNTYLLITPADGDKYHSFNILFNTSEASFETSKWILSEDAEIVISYKLPFSSRTGLSWEGEPDGDKTLGDVLLEGGEMANEVYFNYTENIQIDTAAYYEYAPTITKESVVNQDGTIDYTVVFYNSVPGTYNNDGYLNNNVDMAYFVDTFDERLEYVPGSLKVVCYDPWRDGLWLCRYGYDGEITGNTINVSSRQLLFEEYNYAGAQYDANGNEMWGTWLAGCYNYRSYYRGLAAGGKHVFTYTLQVKEEYRLTVDHSKLLLDNTAEVTWDNGGTSGPISQESEFETGLVDKKVVQKDDKLDFEVHINRNALDMLSGTDKITIDDTMSNNLSVYWNTIKVVYENENGEWIDFDSDESQYDYTVTYNPDLNRLTFVLPDSLHMKIIYTTLITQSGQVSVKNDVYIEGKAQVSDFIDASFFVEKHSGGASGSLNSITLLKQDGVSNAPLANASFHLYGPVSGGVTVPSGVAPTVTASGITLYYIATYTTDAVGTAEIISQYLTQSRLYALVECSAPAGYNIRTEPVLFYYYEQGSDESVQTVTTLITIANFMESYVLPETGGYGTHYLYIIGGLLITLSTVFLLCLYKKRQRKEGRRIRE